MKVKVLRKPSDLYKVAMTVCVIILAFIVYIFSQQLRAINDSASSIAEANEIQFELENIITAVNTNEVALKNYLLTDNKLFLEERERITERLNSYKNNYINLLKSNSGDGRSVDSLQIMLSKRRKLGEEIILLHNEKPRDSRRINVRLIGRNNYTSLLNSYLKNLMDQQNRNVKYNNERHRNEIRNMAFNAIILTIIVLGVLFFAFRKFYDDVIILNKVNDELKLLNYTFGIAEVTAGFGYWKFNLHNGNMIFSKNFYNIMDKEVGEKIISVESAYSHVHPEDIQMVLSEHETSLENMTPNDFVFRVLLPNDQIRYVNSIGSFTKNNAGDIVKVNSIFDITTSYIASQRLEKSNMKLRAINSELESFNHIASHDLQEPLRKIQMFVSRIEGSDDPSSNEVYQEKIKVTAHRMQRLLTDLLQYSKMVKVDKNFELVDLNNPAEIAREELSERISDKKAEIIVGNLPQVKAIPFQMERLFVNLIGNAVKYSKDDVAPIVSVQEVSMGTENIYSKEISGAHFHKIEVKDNGIGFLPEYAERMFILFKRLTNNQKYSGTGVGLAICKKIMENHNGFIRAEGVEGKGATFYLYFPKIK